MGRLGDLAGRPDIELGELTISPARRLVAGPSDSLHLEPLVMQALMILIDAGGEVVTRSQIFDAVWGSATVGDDSLNRVMAKVRRAAEIAAPGLLAVETIPRTGYRLTGPALGKIGKVEQQGSRLRFLSRRSAIAAGVGAAAAFVAGSVWLTQNSSDPRAADLLERGHQMLRESRPNRGQEAVALLDRSVELDPDNPRGWGLLALAHRNLVENGDASEATNALRAAERAANRALKLDPDNGDALTALATLRPEFGNWEAVERDLRTVLAIQPDCIAALNALTLVLQAVGRARESFELNERAATLDPLDVTPQYRLAIKNWIFNRVDSAVQVLERAWQIWPSHPVFWNTRLMILSFSGRISEASRYLERSVQANPALSVNGNIWRVAIAGLQNDVGRKRARARDELMMGAAQSSGTSIVAIMALSKMGMVDDAFEVADGYYRWRGPVAGAEKTGPRELLVNDSAWRRTMALFTPATRAMRLDPRFIDLAEGIGMADYWRRTRTHPDAFLFT